MLILYNKQQVFFSILDKLALGVRSRGFVLDEVRLSTRFPAIKTSMYHDVLTDGPMPCSGEGPREGSNYVT